MEEGELYKNLKGNIKLDFAEHVYWALTTQDHKRTKCLCSQKVQLNPQDNAVRKSFTAIA